jgi:hypothetical protein
VAKKIELLFKDHDLHEKAKRFSVELSTAVYCAPAEKTDSLLTFGLTTSDVSTKDLITKTPIGQLNWVKPGPQALQSSMKESLEFLSEHQFVHT